MIPKILESYSKDIVPYVSDIIDHNKQDINVGVAKTFDSLFTLSKNGTDNVFTMTKLGANLKQIPVILDTKVSVLIDDLLGEGSYDKLPETIEKLLNTKLSEVISKLEQKGIKIDELVEVIDKVLVNVTGDETATLEAIIGFDLVGAIDNLDKTKTIKQIITNYGITEQQINDALDQLETMLAEYKNKSIYDIIFSIGDGVDEEMNEIKTTIKSIIDASADVLDESINLKIIADNKGNLKSVNYGVTVNGASTKSQALYDVIGEIANVPQSVITMLSSVKATISTTTTIA